MLCTTGMYPLIRYHCLRLEIIWLELYWTYTGYIILLAIYTSIRSLSTGSILHGVRYTYIPGRWTPNTTGELRGEVDQHNIGVAADTISLHAYTHGSYQQRKPSGKHVTAVINRRLRRFLAESMNRGCSRSYSCQWSIKLRSYWILTHNFTSSPHLTFKW